MTKDEVDHHVLFGVLALRTGLVTREALAAGFSTWLADKSRSLGWIFVERQVLSEGENALLEALTRAHSGRHGGDPRRAWPRSGCQTRSGGT